jgi:hypothetical protein
VSDEDIEIAEFWLDMWEAEIAEDENNDREIYAEDRKVILAVRRIIAVAKQAKGGEA